MWGHRNLPWVILLCIHNGEPVQLYIHFNPVYEAKSTLFWWVSICYTVVVMVARIHFLRETSSYKGPMLYTQSINPSERANWSVPCILQLCPTSSFNSSSLNGMKRPWVQKDIPPNPDTLPQPYFSFPGPWNSLSNFQELYEASFQGLCTWMQLGTSLGQGMAWGYCWWECRWDLDTWGRGSSRSLRGHTLQSGARMWREEHGPGTKDSVLSTKRPALPDHCDPEWNSKESEKFKF